jgi:hypothetical protein
MTEEKIIEMAKRYGQLENIDHSLAWVLSEDALLDFVQAAIQEETKEYTDLIAHSLEVLRRHVPPARKSRPQPKARLKDEQILDAANSADFKNMVTADDFIFVIARAIERKVWEIAE